MSRAPSIIYLNTHDTGRAVGPMGHPARTPNLQRLADQGVLFRNCHCAGPTCSPSRAALMTGMVPHSCGMLGLGHRGWSLTDPGWTIASHLRDHGYATAAWGMANNHCGGNPALPHERIADLHGYSQLIPGDIEQAAAWLSTPPDGPFFLSVSWHLTHRTGRGFATAPNPALHDPRHTLPPAPLPDTAAVRADWAHFLADVAEWDRQLGLMLDALERSGRAQDTIVIVTTDHGVPFPAMKCSPTKHGTGVFLVMRGPGGFTGGLAVDHLVSQIDLFPTLCAAVGVPVPQRVQGVDLAPTLTGAPVRTEVTAEVTYHAAYEPWRALRTDRHLYVRRFGERRTPVLPNCDASPSRDVWLETGWADHQLPDEELYDTVFDPQEARNLINDPARAAVLRELRARLDAWMHATDDPLLRGDVPLPRGALSTAVDELNPGGPRMIHGR